MKADICAQEWCRDVVLGRKIIAACRVHRVITAAIRRLAFGDSFENRVFDRTSFPGIAHKSRAKSRDPNFRVRQKQVFDQKTLEIEKSDILEPVPEINDGS